MVDRIPSVRQHIEEQTTDGSLHDLTVGRGLSRFATGLTEEHWDIKERILAAEGGDAPRDWSSVFPEGLHYIPEPGEHEVDQAPPAIGGSIDLFAASLSTGEPDPTKSRRFARGAGGRLVRRPDPQGETAREAIELGSQILGKRPDSEEVFAFTPMETHDAKLAGMALIKQLIHEWRYRGRKPHIDSQSRLTRAEIEDDLSEARGIELLDADLTAGDTGKEVGAPIDIEVTDPILPNVFHTEKERADATIEHDDAGEDPEREEAVHLDIEVTGDSLPSVFHTEIGDTFTPALAEKLNEADLLHVDGSEVDIYTFVG